MTIRGKTVSDIQRYEAYISGVCESGCGESMNDNGEYVKYDDHIAEIEQTMEWAKSSYAEMKAKLQAEVETTEQLKIMYKNQLFEAEARIEELEALEKAYSRKWDWMQARIEELEPVSRLWKQRYLDLKDLNDENFGNIKKWKAEGIRDMVKAFKRQAWEMHCDNFAIKYADKLLEAKQ